MKHFSQTHIAELPKIFRTNMINGISGYKSGNLIGTISNSSITNLSICSSVVHIGANPPLLGFVMRPETVRRDTLANIRETGFYTINHIHSSFVEKAHYTSAKFDKDDSEFDKVGLDAEYLNEFKAPYVKESQLKMGLKLMEEIPIAVNETILIMGKIEHIYMPEDILNMDGFPDLTKVEDICISGLNTYHSVARMATFPYARPEDINLK